MNDRMEGISNLNKMKEVQKSYSISLFFNYKNVENDMHTSLSFGCNDYDTKSLSIKEVSTLLNHPQEYNFSELCRPKWVYEDFVIALRQ